MSSPPDLRLAWCSYEAAKYAVEHWHYSRSMPPPPIVKLGTWEDDRFIGCVTVSRGSAQNLGRPFGLDQTEIAELTRVALRHDHAAPVSRIVAIAVRLLRQQCPGLRLLVSFADPGQGHHGGIYQAAGWLYLGERGPTTEFRDSSGRQWHGRMISPTGRKKVFGHYRAVLRPDQCEAVVCPGKHKYALPLDPAMRAQIVPLAKPYPKRAPEALVADATADQAVEGGAVPTSALQIAHALA